MVRLQLSPMAPLTLANSVMPSGHPLPTAARVITVKATACQSTLGTLESSTYLLISFSASIAALVLGFANTLLLL